MSSKTTTMKRRLSRKEKDAVKNQLGRHPLYRAIHGCCKQFETALPTLRFSPEEVLCEVAERIDDWLGSDEKPAMLTLTLWDDLLGDIRDMSPECPREECETAAAMTLTMLATTTNCVDSQLLNTLTLHTQMQIKSHYPEWKEVEERILSHLWRGLDEPLLVWMSEYVASEDCLSDQIAELLESVGMESGTASGQLPSPANNPDTGSSDTHNYYVPSEIDKKGVRPLLEQMRDKGWLDEDMIPPKNTINNTQAAMMAYFITKRLFIPPNWSVFEEWWGRKGLRQSLNRSEKEGDYSDFKAALKELK